MSDVAAATAAPSGNQPGEPTVAPVPVQSRRMSELGTSSQPIPGMVDLRDEMAGKAAAKPANVQQPEAAEPESQLEAQPETQPETAEELPEGALTPEQKAAKYEEWLSSPDLPEELLTRTVWDADGFPNTVEQLLKRDRAERLTYKDYQHKTTELAKKTRQADQMQAGMMAFQRDLLSGDPQQAMKAMRWMGAEKSMHSMVVAYVQRMARLEGLAPELRDEFLSGERARDEAEVLRRQLQARQQQEQQLAEQQAQTQGIDAPDIQHVMGHIDKRLPDICKELGVPQSDAFNRELGEVLVRATEGDRGPDGRWLTAPTLQRGRTPTDDTLRQLVGAAWESTRALIAGTNRRQPARQQLPPPPAAVTGPAAKPGTRGHIGQPQRKRFSDMR